MTRVAAERLASRPQREVVPLARSRTCDAHAFNVSLYRLSYSDVVRAAGFEPATFGLSGRRTSSCASRVQLAPRRGLEPRADRSDSPASPLVARRELANTVDLESTTMRVKAALREPLCIRVRGGPVWNRTTLGGFGDRYRPRRTGPMCFRTTRATAVRVPRSPGSPIWLTGLVSNQRPNR